MERPPLNGFGLFSSPVQPKQGLHQPKRLAMARKDHPLYFFLRGNFKGPPQPFYFCRGVHESTSPTHPAFGFPFLRSEVRAGGLRSVHAAGSPEARANSRPAARFSLASLWTSPSRVKRLFAVTGAIGFWGKSQRIFWNTWKYLLFY